MRAIKIVVERHPDTYIAYPIGLGGVVVGQGDTFEEALESAKSATLFHIESFGLEHLLSTENRLEQSDHR
jgi:predicted RNase H-like HicB family nuclease